MNFLLNETLFLYEITYAYHLNNKKEPYLYFETDPFYFLKI
ncbi:hypothetical protein QMO_2705 [Clostridioides difficile DA00305]|nr:hypothetical protein QMO_2705 [Clostridioides difficile DA00305]